MPSDLPTVYLAGPIDNVGHDDAEDWRSKAKHMLGTGAEAVDPYEAQPDWPGDPEGNRELREWCFEQARECDVVLVGNLDPEIVTRGTAQEIREAEVHGTPIVVQSPCLPEVSNFVSIPADGGYESLSLAVQHTLDIVKTAATDATEAGSA